MKEMSEFLLDGGVNAQSECGDTIFIRNSGSGSDILSIENDNSERRVTSVWLMTRGLITRC